MAALVNKDTVHSNKEVIKKLEEKLLEYYQLDKYVNIHVNTKGVVIRYCIIPEEIDIKANYVYVNAGLFALEVGNHSSLNELDIRIEVEDKIETFIIQWKDAEVYFDFCMR